MSTPIPVVLASVVLASVMAVPGCYTHPSRLHTLSEQELADELGLAVCGGDHGHAELCRNYLALIIRDRVPSDDHRQEALAGRVQSGMTAEYVRLAWGSPVRVRSYSDSSGSHATWDYSPGAVTPRYVVFYEGRAVWYSSPD